MTDLFIDDVEPYANFTVTSSQSIFPFSFFFLKEEHIELIIDGVLQTTGYNLIPLVLAEQGGFNSGQINLTSPITSGSVTIRRNTGGLKKDSNVPRFGYFDLNTLNLEIARAICIMQESFHRHAYKDEYYGSQDLDNRFYIHNEHDVVVYFEGGEIYLENNSGVPAYLSSTFHLTGNTYDTDQLTIGPTTGTVQTCSAINLDDTYFELDIHFDDSTVTYHHFIHIKGMFTDATNFVSSFTVERYVYS